MGPTIPGIRILEKLAEGGSSLIYRAEDLRTHEPRAVKVLRLTARGDAKMLKEFRAEATLLKELNHEGLVKIHGCGAAGGDEFMVRELFEGTNLKSLLQQKSVEVPRVTLDLFVATAEALCYLHLHGIIHKDVKPENILVHPPSGRVKLIDLSIAEKVDAGGGLFSAFGSARKSTVEGTPSYMSPEQIQGKSLDHRTDVYSLGATMYEVLSGAPPFIGRSQDEVLRKHLKEPPKDIPDKRKEIPYDVYKMVLQMLEKDPIRRPDLHAVLRRLSKAKAPPPRPVRVPARPKAAVPPAPAPTTPAEVAPAEPSRHREHRMTVKDARVTFICRAEVDTGGKPIGRDGFVVNLSRDGLGFETATPPKPQSEIDMVVVVPPVSKAMRLTGLARWVHPAESGLQSVGVFLPDPPIEYMIHLEKLRKALRELD